MPHVPSVGIAVFVLLNVKERATNSELSQEHTTPDTQVLQFNTGLCERLPMYSPWTHGRAARFRDMQPPDRIQLRIHRAGTGPRLFTN